MPMNDVVQPWHAALRLGDPDPHAEMLDQVRMMTYLLKGTTLRLAVFDRRLVSDYVMITCSE